MKVTQKKSLLILAIFSSMLLTSCKENYSNGEKVGNLIEFTQKGVWWYSWEGRLNMTQTGMNTSGEPFSFGSVVKPSCNSSPHAHNFISL